jgi:hypothetical protein
MTEIRRWFGWLIVVLIAHLAEQFLFGIDELEEIKRFGAVYYSWFSNPDYASVVLIGLIVLIVQALLYATLLGGNWRLLPFGYFGVVGIAELHHVVKTILHQSYFPGAVTAIAFATVGGLLLRAVVQEWRAPLSHPSGKGSMIRLKQRTSARG